jgi:uncharacterized membrane protein
MREAIFTHFAQNVLASTIVGLGFGTGSIVYTFDSLRMWQKVLIHMGGGMVIYYIVAFSYGWVQAESPSVVIPFIIMSLLISSFIWLGFYFSNKAEARKINERLKAQQEEE